MKGILLTVAIPCMITVSFIGCPTLEPNTTGLKQIEDNQDNSTGTYQVNQETYDKTFDDIYLFIEKIQRIMDTRDFASWMDILTPEYQLRASDPFYLKELSGEPSLKNKNITLNDIKDYFLYVFIPSRTGINMDKIVFLSRERVKVITIVNNIHYVIYLLEKGDNDSWKIGAW